MSTNHVAYARARDGLRSAALEGEPAQAHVYLRCERTVLSLFKFAVGFLKTGPTGYISICIGTSA